jgi:hypothetical protein
MAPLKPQSPGRFVDIIQWGGLISLIAFTYKHFGPGATTPITPTAIAVFAGAVFLLLGPIPLKFKE